MAHQRAPFYNTDDAVGKFLANRSDDVMLVQLFLSELSTRHTIFLWHKPTTPLAVNGVADDNLFAWIKSYQSAVNIFAPVTVDGIINRVPGEFTGLTSNTKTKYTLMYLNNHYESLFPDKYRNLPNDQSVPTTLRTSLKQRKR